MSDYAWPTAWKPSRFELRVIPNTRVYTGPYTPTTQVIDLMGERWAVSLDLPPDTDPVLGAAYEAFFDRLKGPANRMVLWNLRFPAPQGTLRATDTQAVSVVNGSLAAVTVQNGTPVTINVVSGTPVLAAFVAQGSNTATIQCIPGRTVLAGDMLGLASQTVRAMTSGTADGSGNLTLEFQPRARQDIAAYTLPVTDKPTINFILKGDGVPIVHRPGMFEGPTLEAIEAF